MVSDATIPPDPDTTYVSISHQGSVSMDTSLIHVTYCIFELIDFPFDEQECHVIIIAQNADSGQIILNPTSVTHQAEDKHPQWDVEEITGLSFQWTRSGGVDDDGVSFPITAVDITIRLSRLPTFYVQNIILPIFLLGLMGIGSFLIPLKSGERASVCISVVLGITIFQIVLSDVLPKTSRSDQMPILFSYASKTFFVLVALTTTSFFTIKLSYWSGDLRSTFLRILFFKVFAVVVLLRKEGQCHLKKYTGKTKNQPRGLTRHNYRLRALLKKKNVERCVFRHKRLRFSFKRRMFFKFLSHFRGNT